MDIALNSVEPGPQLIVKGSHKITSQSLSAKTVLIYDWGEPQDYLEGFNKMWAVFLLLLFLMGRTQGLASPGPPGRYKL